MYDFVEHISFITALLLPRDLDDWQCYLIVALSLRLSFQHSLHLYETYSSTCLYLSYVYLFEYISIGTANIVLSKMHSNEAILFFL